MGINLSSFVRIMFYKMQLFSCRDMNIFEKVFIFQTHPRGLLLKLRFWVLFGQYSKRYNS